MPVDKKSLDNFSELELIAYCLNEMTYSGFEQEEIQEEFNRIKGVKEEYDSLSPEEKAKRTHSFDEVKDMFKTKDEESDSNDNDENE